jgi:competence protein ComEA
MALGLVVTAVLLGAGLGAVGAGTTSQGATTIEPAQPNTGGGTGVSSTFPVYVSGWVSTPGVVQVGEGAIVADAVSLAGGALEGALLDTVNLARPLAEGDHVQIPGPGDASTGGSTPATGSDGLIRINQADATTLEELPGVGPVLAERIVAHREANGPFEAVEDLLEVPGIGEAKLASMRDQIRVP